MTGNLGRCFRFSLLGLLGLSAAVDAGPHDGDWQLSITGHQDFIFGESGLGGGVRIPWEVIIQFEVADGVFGLGSGSARWLDRTTALSRPAGWFQCEPVEGSYLDSNLTLHETPRVRFAGFPVAGEVAQGRVRLQPAYRPPGNYLAVTYQCQTENPIAENWFALAERGKQVMGKRQDAETRREGDQRSARVREVAALPPEAALDLPLLDGWTFAQGGDDDARQSRFELMRLR